VKKLKNYFSNIVKYFIVEVLFFHSLGQAKFSKIIRSSLLVHLDETGSENKVKREEWRLLGCYAMWLY
jgi:hypothetical protein